jgi:hypothetical protein
MNRLSAALVAAALLLVPSLRAASPDQEKAFVQSYRKALESGDTSALAGFLYTVGAQPEQIEFFKMMQAIDPGATIRSIELVTPSAEQLARLNQPMEMPDGQTYQMPILPIKQLVVVTETKDASGSGTSTRKAPVAEKDGKLVIPVPVPTKK